MNTIESNNKMIDLFMGAQIVIRPKGEKLSLVRNIQDKCLEFYPNDLKYHTSWDWLMSVIQKIKSEEFFKTVGGNGMAYVLDLKIDEALITADIQKVYNAVVEFIKWYNQQSK